MTIPFKQIPSTLRVPLFFAEIDPSQANSGQEEQRILIIGQITSAGIATPNVPIISQGVDDASLQGGLGSMLALMTNAYRLNDNFGEVWYLPLADAEDATAATGAIAFTDSPSVNGTVSLYIGGQLVAVGVAATETATAIATAVAAAINENTNLPVSATSATGTVTLTARNAGPLGNDIDIRLNYQGSLGGEATPTGLTVAVTAMSGGATTPTLTTGLANLQDQAYDLIVMPYTDTTSLNAMKAFLNDVSGRWSWDVQVYGHCWTALRGEYSALVTAGTACNDQHTTIMGFYDSPTTTPEWAAAMAGAAAVSLRADPGVPLQTLALQGVLAPPIQSRFLLSERNTLLYDGISTFTVAADGTVQLENVITTYQLNSFSQPDDSYLEVETMYLLMYVLTFMSDRVTTKFSRMKLAQDGTNFAPGSNIVTPSIIKADQIAAFAELEYNGFTQNSEAFAQNIIVEINATNPNRVDVLWPGTLIDQLRIFAMLAQFRLS